MCKYINIALNNIVDASSFVFWRWRIYRQTLFEYNFFFIIYSNRERERKRGQEDKTLGLALRLTKFTNSADK